MECNFDELSDVLNELNKYPSPIFERYSGSSTNNISELEGKLNFRLPADFKEFLSITNGAILDCQHMFGIKNDNRANDLYLNYLWETCEAGNPMKSCYLPFLPDGMGNHNCLDLSTLSEDGKKCNVIFWQHDRLYEDGEGPDVDAESFTEFLKKMLS